MKNYEKVVEMQKKIGKENAERAKEAIIYLYTHNKLVTVKELVKMTGLSRSYFYKNVMINDMLKKTIATQKGDDSLSTKNEVFNLAFAKSNETLENQLRILQHKCYCLNMENKKLKEKIASLKSK